jgi:hypothetical protein
MLILSENQIIEENVGQSSFQNEKIPDVIFHCLNSQEFVGT